MNENENVNEKRKIEKRREEEIRNVETRREGGKYR
jgi:hypothetical protein